MPPKFDEIVGAWRHYQSPEVGVRFVTEGEPWLPNGRIRTIEVWGPDLKYYPIPNALHLGDLRLLLEALASCQLWSPNVFETMRWASSKLGGWSPRFVGDTLTAARLLGEEVDTSTGTDQWTPLQTLKLRLQSSGLLPLYETEVHVAAILGEASGKGYQTAEGPVYPIWTSLHPSGNARMLCSAPPLNSWTIAQRTEVMAPRGFKWVRVEYPRLDARVLAAMADESELFDALAVSSFVAEDTLNTVIRKGATDDFTTLPGSELLHPLQAHLIGVGELGVSHGVVTGLLNRATKVRLDPSKSEGHARRSAAAAYVQNSGATVLKLALRKMVHMVEEQRFRMFAGFQQVFPHFDSIAYILSDQVPFDRHLSALWPLMQVHFATRGKIWQLSPLISVGSSLGEFRSVEDPWALIEADLGRPGDFPIVCPLCELRAPSEAVLEVHLREDHPDEKPTEFPPPDEEATL